MIVQVPNYLGRPGAGDTIFRVLDELATQVKAIGSGCNLHQICRLICNPENSFLYKHYPDEASLAAHLAPPTSNKSLIDQLLK